MSIAVRPATAADKAFVITAIIEAEKSGSDVISYCGVFGINVSALRKLLEDILDEDIAGQELCLDSFLIAEVEGKPAAALAAWVEGAEGAASGLIKSNMLVYYIGADAMLAALPAIELVAKANIERAHGALQIESVYVTPEQRGKGLTRHLIEAQMKRWSECGFAFEKVQIILMDNNVAAKNTYEKMGFTVVKSQTVHDPEIHRMLPGATKILMERKTK